MVETRFLHAERKMWATALKQRAIMEGAPMRAALAFFFLILFMPFSGMAALIVPSSEIVSMHVSPAHPKPGELITATVSSTGDTNAFSYEWTVNGRVVAQGSDERTVVFTAGAAGSQTNISVLVVGENGDIRGSAARVIRPAEIDIVWEGRTYVPPFYGGRPLPSGSSAVALEAMRQINSQLTVREYEGFE